MAETPKKLFRDLEGQALEDFINQLVRESVVGRPKILQFIAFDRLNPRVWQLFQSFTFEMIDRGMEHYSSDAVLHRVRWETVITTIDSAAFKLNNNYTAFYARKFHALYPEHGDFFRLRRSCADGLVSAFQQEVINDRREAA